MEKDLFKILKQLQNIQPDLDYSNQSRLLILLKNNNEKHRGYAVSDVLSWLNLHRMISAASLISAFIIIVFLTVSYLPGNKNNLVAEANEVNSSIQIRLDEIKYLLENQSPINLDQADIAREKLELSAQALNEANELNAQGVEMEKILKKIKAAEQALNEIELLLSQ